MNEIKGFLLIYHISLYVCPYIQMIPKEVHV